MTPAAPVTPEPEYPALRWRIPNELLLIAAGGLFFFYLAAALIQNQQPFDYVQLIRGVRIYCNDPTHFVYGVSTYTDGLIQRNFYPAPFYSAFCVPDAVSPNALFLIWMLFPFVWAVILSKQRAAIFAYAPLFLHILLGQSTAFLIPLYYLAANPRPPRWWYGIIIATALFKPHVAAPAVLILLWRWRHHWGAWITAAVSSIAFLIPTFLHTPDWIQQWLGSARGFEIISLATVARVPIRALNMPYVPAPDQQRLIWGFAVVVAIVVLGALWYRRKRLTFYDIFLVFCFTAPLVHDYDLVILIPFLVQRPKRLLLAVTAGLPAWIYAMMSGTPDRPLGFYNLSLLITLALIAERLLDLKEGPFESDVRKSNQYPPQQP
jgi:hypothetical protein